MSDSEVQAEVLAKAGELQGREARLLAAQEVVLRQAAQVEADAVSHAAEASAAISRLRVECAHQLAGEAKRQEEAGKAKVEAEAELAAAQVQLCSHVGAQLC
jgi:centrosomal protein CEP120